jgi:hypothetical protein
MDCVRDQRNMVLRGQKKLFRNCGETETVMEQIQSGTTGTVSSHPRTATIAQCPFSPEASPFGTGREVLIDIRTAIEIGYDCFGVDRMLGLSSDVFALLQAMEGRQDGYASGDFESPDELLAALPLQEYEHSSREFFVEMFNWFSTGNGVKLRISGVWDGGRFGNSERRRATINRKAPRVRRAVGRRRRKGSWTVDDAGQLTLRCLGFNAGDSGINQTARVRMHTAQRQSIECNATVVRNHEHYCFTFDDGHADVTTAIDKATLIELTFEDECVSGDVQVWARLRPNGVAQFITPVVPFRPRLRDFCNVFKLTAATVDAAEAIRSRLDLLNVSDCLHVPQRGFGALSAAQAWELFTQRKTSTRLRKTPAQQEAHS